MTGDVAGGVAFVKINYADGFTEKAGVKIRYYAGLLSDTDLGRTFWRTFER